MLVQVNARFWLQPPTHSTWSLIRAAIRRSVFLLAGGGWLVSSALVGMVVVRLLRERGKSPAIPLARGSKLLGTGIILAILLVMVLDVVFGVVSRWLLASVPAGMVVFVWYSGVYRSRRFVQNASVVLGTVVGILLIADEKWLDGPGFALFAYAFLGPAAYTCAIIFLVEEVELISLQ